MNNTHILIAALAGAPEIIIGLVREVPPQHLTLFPEFSDQHDIAGVCCACEGDLFSVAGEIK